MEFDIVSDDVFIGMRVEMQDGDRAETIGGGFDKRKRHRMIAAEGERNFSIFTHIGDVTADHRVVLQGVFGEREVAVVGEGDVGAKFRAELARKIAAVTPQLCADCRGSRRGAALEAAVDVGGKAEEADGGHGVAVYNPDGSQSDFIEIPQEMCTSVCFGGADLKSLYIVTGSEGTGSQRGGAVYRISTSVAGLPVAPARVTLSGS